MQAPASDAAWLAFSDYVVNQGQSLSASGVYSWFFQWHAVGGTASAISAVAQDATAYGLRDSLLIGQIYVSIAGGGDPTEAYSFADAAWQTLTTQVAGYGAYRK